MPTKTKTKAQLESEKLQAEIRAIRAREKKTLLEVEYLEQERENERAHDLANRTFTFYGEVDDGPVSECLDAVNTWFRQDPKAPITINLNSPGGYTVDGFALYDRLRQIVKAGCPVITVGTGHVASMGGVLLMGGSKRVMTENCYLLIHEAAGLAMGKGSSMKDKAKHLDDIFKRICRIMESRSNLSATQIKNRADRKDYILWAEEALSLGFCDEVA